MEKANAETQELDPEEMEQAAGGVCFADYDCYTAWNHDSPDQEGSACFADYDCVSVYHNSKVLENITNEELMNKAKEPINFIIGLFGG